MTAGIETAVEGRIGTITLNRPEVLHALDDEMLREMRDVLSRWDGDSTVDVVILTGAGDRAFAAGADIEGLSAKDSVELAARSGMQEFMAWLESYPAITIAAVNGYAFGGGFELAMSCDIRIASEKAKLGLPELGLGIIPGATGTQRLTALAGASAAMFHVLTGATMTAARAYELGVVSEVTAPEELRPRARQLAEGLLSKGPTALRLAKVAIRAATPQSENGRLVEKLAQAVLFGTAERTEGMSAFLEKRSPRFNGEA